MSEIASKVESILSQMTLKEKVSQMFQTDPNNYFRSTQCHTNFSGAVTGPENERIISKDIVFSIGSILNSHDAETSYRIQKEYLENSRLKIPLLFMYDIIHGFKTIFPIPLGLACSWDATLVEATARSAALEGNSAGINITFAPMADLVRDARWGRVMESSGEDPLLNSLMASAYVKGFQGDKLGADGGIGACIKHFAGYGAAEGGRDYNTVEVSERTLRNFYLTGYKAGIDAGAAMVMTSFNTYDSVPATGNQFLLRQILRNEWGFRGVVISDWTSIAEMISHMAAEDGYAAAKLAVEAGVDIEMVSNEYVCNLEKLVSDGVICEKLIDDAVRRILELKFKLGLFEDPYRYIRTDLEKKYHLCKEHRELAKKAAIKSMVLLKNENILPINKNVKSIAVIGPFADSGHILGSWKALGKEEDAVTLKQGLVNKLGMDTHISVERGCDWLSDDTSGLASAIKTAENADVIILALGEHQNMSGEAASRAYLNLPGQQPKLAEEIMKLNKPTVLVLFNGRPLELKWFHENVPAILEAWFPGTEGGNAIADVLFGDANPSGKLTMSFPYTVGQVPVYYNHFSTGRPKANEQDNNRFVSKYIDIPNTPLYPFGYGLSYSSFEYSNIQTSGERLTYGGSLTVSVDVTNTGAYAGEEIVQMYIRDLYGSTARPVLELKDFKKLSLVPGQMETVSFEISEDRLCYYGLTGKYSVEPGRFKVFIGPNSSQLHQECEFEFE